MSISIATENFLEKKRILIFDFDGTVADTSPLHAEAFKKTLSALGIVCNYSEIAGMRTSDAIRKCLFQNNLSLTEREIFDLVEDKQKIVRTMITESLSALPGADAFIRWAESQYQLSMVTSGSRGTIQLSLEKLGYLKLFNPLICAEDIEFAKPDPEGFLQVLSLTGFTADQALIFEDSAAGIEAAKIAGIEFIDVTKTDWISLMKIIQ